MIRVRFLTKLRMKFITIHIINYVTDINRSYHLQLDYYLKNRRVDTNATGHLVFATELKH